MRRLWWASDFKVVKVDGERKKRESEGREKWDTRISREDSGGGEAGRS